jgi:cysteinyl-tRNA synthetase
VDESQWARLVDVLADDFNTPDALAILHDWRSAGQDNVLLRGLSVFGLDSLGQRAEAPDDVQRLKRQRDEARERRDFAEADRLRDEMLARGWEARDYAGGTVLVPRE